MNTQQSIESLNEFEMSTDQINEFLSEYFNFDSIQNEAEMSTDQINKIAPEHFVSSPSDVYQTDLTSFADRYSLEQCQEKSFLKIIPYEFPEIRYLVLFFDWLTEIESLKVKYSANLTSTEDITDRHELPIDLNLPRLLNMLMQLRMLNLPKLYNLHNLYKQHNLQSMTGYSRLYSLYSLLKQPNLHELLNLYSPHKPIELNSLTLKYDNNCFNLLADLKELFNLPNLRQLTLKDCKKLISLYEISNLAERLSGLTDLTLRNCTTLKSLAGIENLANHPTLISLTIKNCYTLESLAAGTENLQPDLRQLTLFNCYALELRATDIEKLLKLMPKLINLTFTGCHDSISSAEIKKEVAKIPDTKLKLRIRKLRHDQKLPTNSTFNNSTAYFMPKLPARPDPTGASLGQVLAGWASNRSMPKRTKRPNLEGQTGASLEQVLSGEEQSLSFDPPCKRQKEGFTNGSHLEATGCLFPMLYEKA